MTVQQGGIVTPGHVSIWATDGVIQDGGTATEPAVNSLGLYGNGGTPLAITNSATPWPFTGTYTTLGLGVSSNAAYLNVYGTPGLPLQFLVNSILQMQVSATGVTIPTLVLTTPLTLANGGTGVSTIPANGQLLIGNGSGYTVANLTAGLNVGISNTAGGITISSSVGPTGVLPVTNGGTGVTTSTGSGSVVLSTSFTTHGTITFAP